MVVPQVAHEGSEAQETIIAKDAGFAESHALILLLVLLVWESTLLCPDRMNFLLANQAARRRCTNFFWPIIYDVELIDEINLGLSV